MTPAEKLFWALVRNRQVLGKNFNRQHPLTFQYEGARGFFIADFYCHEQRLIVEIDGGVHETQQEYDQLRTAIIQCEGIRVIRFTNEEVVHHIDRVKSKLEKVLRGRGR